MAAVHTEEQRVSSATRERRRGPCGRHAPRWRGALATAAAAAVVPGITRRHATPPSRPRGASRPVLPAADLNGRDACSRGKLGGGGNDGTLANRSGPVLCTLAEVLVRLAARRGASGPVNTTVPDHLAASQKTCIAAGAIGAAAQRVCRVQRRHSHEKLMMHSYRCHHGRTLCRRPVSRRSVGWAALVAGPSTRCFRCFRCLRRRHQNAHNRG